MPKEDVWLNFVTSSRHCGRNSPRYVFLSTEPSCKAVQQFNMCLLRGTYRSARRILHIPRSVVRLSYGMSANEIQMSNRYHRYHRYHRYLCVRLISQVVFGAFEAVHEPSGSSGPYKLVKLVTIHPSGITARYRHIRLGGLRRILVIHTTAPTLRRGLSYRMAAAL